MRYIWRLTEVTSTHELDCRQERFVNITALCDKTNRKTAINFSVPARDKGTRRIRVSIRYIKDIKAKDWHYLQRIIPSWINHRPGLD